MAMDLHFPFDLTPVERETLSRYNVAVSQLDDEQLEQLRRRQTYLARHYSLLAKRAYLQWHRERDQN